MAQLNESFSVRALFELRETLELGDGMFKAITGVDAKDLMAFRRGRSKEKPVISKESAECIERCKKGFGLALELCGDNERALDWFYADAPSFGGKSPIDLTLNPRGVEKIQRFVDAMRNAIALTGGLAPAELAKSLQASAPTIEKPAPPVVFEKPKEIPASKPEKPLGNATAGPAKASPLPPDKTKNGTYIPAGMARSRPQVQPSTEPPNGKSMAGSDILAVKPTTTAEAERTTAPITSLEAPVGPAFAGATTAPGVHVVPSEKATQSPKNVVELNLPPTGVDPEKRIFLLKDPLSRIRENKPNLTLVEISNLMVQRGFERFAVATHASRLSKSYTWATWNEVVHLADIFGADPYQLGSVRAE